MLEGDLDCPFCGDYPYRDGGPERFEMGNEPAEMWDFEYDLVEQIYGNIPERGQVNMGDELLEVFVSTAKIEIPEGGEGSSTFSSMRSTCHSAWGCWCWWWARSRGAKADCERFEVNQGGQGIDEVDW
jgi:hypothetical protein